MTVMDSKRYWSCNSDTLEIQNAIVPLSAAFICVRLLKCYQNETFQNRERFFCYDVAEFTCTFYDERAILKRSCATTFVLLRSIVEESLRSWGIIYAEGFIRAIKS
jgi:hypothetical protein